ncbi:dUTP diphosphatase [Oceanobacillus jeddahense]|uniref:dUTP diphosphatase n=1 Tax=Oceanobacillus jeddahense TaxID=1462527 RepID=UPI0036449440
MKVKKMHPDAVIPKYANENDSGFDLVAIEDVIIEPGETKLIKTGLAFDIPEGFEIQVRPRSGITLKTKLRVQLGTIDSNYRGEVGVIVDNINQEDPLDDGETLYAPLDVKENVAMDVGHYIGETYFIRKGDRIGQGILAPVARTEFEEVDELSDSERGSNGYGSTGVKHTEEDLQ